MSNTSPGKVVSSETPDVKFAGEEQKAKIYEPRRNKKLIRGLTVFAYVISVSLVAIMLSMYYVFLWDPKLKKETEHHEKNPCPRAALASTVCEMRMKQKEELHHDLKNGNDSTDEMGSMAYVQATTRSSTTPHQGTTKETTSSDSIILSKIYSSSYRTPPLQDRSSSTETYYQTTRNQSDSTVQHAVVTKTSIP